MTKPRPGQSGNWDRERADRLQKDVERMQKDIERLTTEREWSEDRFPCDGGCVDAPEETCSRHGRSPADLWRIIGEVAAERDALAAQVARVEALGEKWLAMDEANADAFARERLDPTLAVRVATVRQEQLQAALAGSEADTGAEEAGHRCEPYYSRAECGQCGWQEQWCVTCSRQMCGCATDTTNQEDQA
jgi:hypothetical protein